MKYNKKKIRLKNYKALIAINKRKIKRTNKT
jgi:hypothetical protein